MSACGGCGGARQLPNEVTKYNPLLKLWLCAGCRAAYPGANPSRERRPGGGGETR